MKFNVPCPRCHGTGKNISHLPELPWRRHGRTHRTARSPDQGRHARWPAHPPRRQGQCRNARRTGGRSLRDHPHRATIPSSTAKATTFASPCRYRHGSGSGSQDEVPTIDGRTLLKIPPGTQSGQKLRLREKGVPSATKEGARGDEIVEDQAHRAHAPGRALQGNPARTGEVKSGRSPRGTLEERLKQSSVARSSVVRS